MLATTCCMVYTNITVPAAATEVTAVSVAAAQGMAAEREVAAVVAVAMLVVAMAVEITETEVVAMVAAPAAAVSSHNYKLLFTVMLIVQASPFVNSVLQF
jgi:hypothetical protein